MQNKKITLSILLLLAINVSLFASFGLDFGLNYNSTEIDSNGDSVDSEYPFSIVALPAYSSGKFSMELNVPVFFKFNDPELVGFDYSNFELPQSEDNFLTDSIAYSKYFLSYINYIQWGTFNEDLALRVGKITNSTIGDGALLYHYKDIHVSKFSTRPGLQIKLDGAMFDLPLGIEFISTDLFYPDLYGGRFYINPLFFLNNEFINKLALGYTVTYNTTYEDPNSVFWLNVVYDLQLPLVKTPDNSIIAYYDLISEAEFDDTTTINRSISQRVGIYGWYLTSFTYDAHIKNIIDDNVSNNSFVEGNLELLAKAALPQLKKDFIVSANTGYYANNGLSEFTLSSDLQFEDISLDNYNLKLEIKSSKAIGPISDIYGSVQKNYLKDSFTNEFTEDFFSGFTSTKNLNINLSANIIFYQVNAITVALSIETDETGDIDPEYSLGYKFSLF